MKGQLMMICAAVVVVCMLLSETVVGHGMVHDPVNRATRWRYDRKAPADYDDNQLFCGGFAKQQSNGGRCGLCGDDYADAVPRKHELGGTYGQGVIVQNYTAGGELPVLVQITANHFGYFYFYLCNLDESPEGREDEECFEKTRLSLTNGDEIFQLETSEVGYYRMELQLPEDLRCEHCVLQWTYNAGNNWGVCEDGTGKVGCGPQENFRTCSDIRIT